MKIPVFHDDQHGTAIIVAAAVLNAMRLAGKDLAQVKLVTSGAGAAALACLNLLVELGIRRENIWVTDIEGVVYRGREKLMDRWKAVFAQETEKRKLAEIIDGADIFLGLSAAGVLKPELLARMAEKPLIMALANPNPEIMPDEAMKVRPDAMMCTGRSDYPNQVNNVLCFPYIFRGALDVQATTINEPMKLAAVRAIAQLALEAPSDVVARAYGGQARVFGKESLIPSPFDPRLILRIAPAVARAAMETGVALKPIADFRAYEEQLSRFVFRSGFVMKTILQAAKADPKRIIYAEGEDERVLRAVQTVVEEGLAVPILIGRPSVVESRLERFGLSIRPGKDFELVNPEDDPRYRDYVQTYIEVAGRKGIRPDAARTLVRTNSTVIAAIALKRGDVDAMLCGVEGRFTSRLRYIKDIIGLAPGTEDFAALSLMVTSKGAYFLADTHVRWNPSAREIADMAILADGHVRRFGLEPKIALLSHSDFGSGDSPDARKMREAVELIVQRRPDIAVDGEMQADTALSEAIREKVLPDARFKGEANVLIMPNLDAANIAYQFTKIMADALPVGPILMGTALPAHILTPSVTARGIVNMTAVAVATLRRGEQPSGECGPELLGGGLKLVLRRHLAGMRLQRHAVEARDDMDMQVEDHLPAGGLVELLDGDAVGAEGLDAGARHLLHRGIERAERIGRHVEHVPGRRLGDHQRVALTARHDVHEGEGVLILVDLVGGQLATQDLGEDVVRIVSGHGLLLPRKIPPVGYGRDDGSASRWRRAYQ